MLNTSSLAAEVVVVLIMPAVVVEAVFLPAPLVDKYHSRQQQATQLSSALEVRADVILLKVVEKELMVMLEPMDRVQHLTLSRHSVVVVAQVDALMEHTVLLDLEQLVVVE